jgi:hypothetical protein
MLPQSHQSRTLQKVRLFRTPSQLHRHPPLPWRLAGHSWRATPLSTSKGPAHHMGPGGWDGLSALHLRPGSVPGALPQAGMVRPLGPVRFDRQAIYLDIWHPPRQGICPFRPEGPSHPGDPRAATGGAPSGICPVRPEGPFHPSLGHRPRKSADQVMEG